MNLSIVSRNTIFRNAVAQLCADRGLTIAGSVDACSKLTPASIGDVMLLHILDYDPDPFEKIAGAFERFPTVKIVALLPESLDLSLDGRFDDRVIACIPETVAPEGLMSALYLAAMGYNVRQPGQAEKQAPAARVVVMQTSPSNGHEAAAEALGAFEDAEGQRCQLSSRELSVLAHLCSGNSNKEIARSLGICDATVKAHLRSSFRRIGASNRTQAAMWALQNLQPMLAHKI